VARYVASGVQRMASAITGVSVPRRRRRRVAGRAATSAARRQRRWPARPVARRGRAAAMLGPPKARDLDLMSLERLVPHDHFYRHVEATLDLNKEERLPGWPQIDGMVRTDAGSSRDRLSEPA
jgi:hypothetical protein